jgi:hypothetical protein
MPLDIHLIHPFDHAHEQQMWESLRASMASAFKNVPGKAVLLGNVNAGKQLDACLITRRGIAVIELKNHSGVLHTPLNDRWYAENKVVHAGGSLNPLEQVRAARFAISDRLRRAWPRAFSGSPEPNWKFAACRAVFQPGAWWINLFDPGVNRWFALSTLDTIAEDLRSLAIDTFNLSDAQIEFVRKTILSVPARCIMHKQQVDIMKNGLPGISIGHLTLGKMVSEFHEPRAAMDRSVKGKISALVREYPLADDNGFVLHLHDIRLLNGERQITVGGNYTGDKKWDRLLHGMRIGVYKHGDACYLQLGPAVPKPDSDWSTRARSATKEMLDQAGGLDVFQTLRDLGAIRIGTKADLLAETNKTRNALCVLFPEDKPEVGLAAYVLTTVLPLLMAAEEEEQAPLAAAA